MMWISQTGPGASGDGPFSVRPPTTRDGVGDALRTAFLPRAHDLPDEISELVKRLR